MIDIQIPVRKWKVVVPCSEANPDAWFPEKDGDGDEVSVPRDRLQEGKEITAKAVCKTCPVTTECLEEAMERNEQHGIWGGMTTKERRRLKKQLNNG